MYNGNLDWAHSIRDFQADPVFTRGSPDLATVGDQITAMQQAPLGEPETVYDARSVFDSRPCNAFDGVFSAETTATSGVLWTITFQAPNGYRIVPREWQVSYDAPGAGSNGNSTVNLVLNESAVPYNSGIIIGPGTSDPLESFFLVEENATFGMTGTNSNIVGTTNVQVNVRCNLIPVTLEQLSYAVENRKPGT